MAAGAAMRRVGLTQIASRQVPGKTPGAGHRFTLPRRVAAIKVIEPRGNEVMSVHWLARRRKELV